MKRLVIWGLIAAFIVGLAGVPAQAQETLSGCNYSSMATLPAAYQEPPGELLLVDVLILRPLGLAAMAVGLAGSIVSLPFAATSCSTDLVARKLLVEPFDYTFCRPVGDIDYCYERANRPLIANPIK